MKELELLLAILPRKINYKGREYSLFIYPGIQGGWTVEYAMGRFYCDAGNGCADDDYYTLYGCESRTLKDSIDVMMRWLKKNIKNDENEKN